MKKILAILFALLAPLSAQAQQSKATLQSEIATDFADNSSNAITAALLRSVTSNIVSSYVDWLTCTTSGSMIYYVGGTPTCLAAGASGTVLTGGTVPSWVANATATTLTANSTPTSGFTVGQILISDGSKLQAAGNAIASTLALGGAAIGSNALAVTGTSLFNNNITTASGISIILGTNGGLFLNNGGTPLQSPSNGVFQLGQYDAAVAVAQTLRVQSVVAGTTATSGQNWTLIGSLPTGTGTSGDIIFQTGVKTGSGTTQGTPTTALTIKGETQQVLIGAGGLSVGAGGIVTTGGIGFSTTNTLDIGTSATVLAPRTVYAGTSFIGPVGTFTTSSTSPLYNGLAITANGTNTLNIAAGKTVVISNGITFAGTDATTMTFPSTNGTVAALNIADQVLTGGANVTSYSIGTVSSGTTTIDCGKNPLQYLTNGGAFTLAAPANDGSCIVRSVNNGSAGTITFSGFTVGSNTGDALTTTNTSAFAIQIWRINGVSRYLISAYQ